MLSPSPQRLDYVKLLALLEVSWLEASGAAQGMMPIAHHNAWQAS